MDRAPIKVTRMAAYLLYSSRREGLIETNCVDPVLLDRNQSRSTVKMPPANTARITPPSISFPRSLKAQSSQSRENIVE
jgi:hypothetical protein